MYHRVLIIAL